MAKGGMSSPYATIRDPPVYHARPEAVVAPWFKDEPEILTGRSHDPDAVMPCNSQTAPFATFHNVPRSYEYIGPLPEAPWNKEIPVHPTHRGRQLRDQYYYTTPFGTSDNYQTRPTSQGSVVEDAPWDKKLPNQLPGRGSGVHEHSKLPSQTAPFATIENFEEQKQYEGPMPGAPWDKDQRPVYQQKAPPEEYFKNVPFGTSENMDHQEKANSAREIDVAPWNKVQPVVISGKTCYDCGGSANSHTAPYATFDNCTTPKPNKKTGFQAPWDRDEVHHNRLPPKPLFYSGDDGSFNAPYATEPR